MTSQSSLIVTSDLGDEGISWFTQQSSECAESKIPARKANSICREVKRESNSVSPSSIHSKCNYGSSQSRVTKQVQPTESSVKRKYSKYKTSNSNEPAVKKKSSQANKIISFDGPTKSEGESKSYGVYEFMSDTWKFVYSNNYRQISPCYIGSDLLNSIVGDAMDLFSASSVEKYKECDVPLGRTYLFHGPQYAEKIAAIEVLASELQANVLHFQSRDAVLSYCIALKEMKKLNASTETKAILLIDNIDLLFEQGRKYAVLDALNALSNTPGVLTVMTTYRIEKFAEQLVSANCFDNCFDFDYPGKTKLEKYFLKFYPDAGIVLAKIFADKMWTREEYKTITKPLFLLELFVTAKKMGGKEFVTRTDEILDDLLSEKIKETKSTIQ